MPITKGSNVRFGDRFGTVTDVIGIHPVYGTAETVTLRMRDGERIRTGVHVDHLDELPRIITDHKPREVIDAWQLTTNERAAFDYLDWDAIEAGNDSASFFRYRGDVHDIGEFITTRSLGIGWPLNEWHGYRSDSFFSGLVIRYADAECESVIVGTYLS